MTGVENMCGIAGFADAEWNDLAAASRGDADVALVHRMCDVIRHRGPDDEGIHVESGVGLGMRRLSIIDLSTGQQPIHNEDRTVWLVFNGEIYNYKALRAELEAAGHVFYTASDTETIVHAYEQWGESAFEHLRGMFGIALVGPPPAHAAARARPRGNQAPALCGAGRTPVLRVRDQVAPHRRRGRSGARSGGARPLPVVSLRAARSIALQRRAQAAAGPLPAVEGRPLRRRQVLGNQRRRAVSRQRGGRRGRTAGCPGRRRAVPHGQRRAARRVPLRRGRLQPRRRTDGGSVQPSRQDVLHRLRRAAVRRAGARADRRAALRHRAPRVRRASRRVVDPRSPRGSLRRAVRGFLGDPDVVRLRDRPPSRDRRVVGRRRRRAVRRVRSVPAASARRAVRPVGASGRPRDCRGAVAAPAPRRAWKELPAAHLAHRQRTVSRLRGVLSAGRKRRRCIRPACAERSRAGAPRRRWARSSPGLRRCRRTAG